MKTDIKGAVPITVVNMNNVTQVYEGADEKAAVRAFCLWESEQLVAVVTDYDLAQRWTQSTRHRGMTTTYVDSPSLVEAVEEAIGKAGR